MYPPSSPPETRRGGGFEIALGCLAVVALILVIAHREVDELRDELRIERGRRVDAERVARDKSRQMDAALEHIHERESKETGDGPGPDGPGE